MSRYIETETLKSKIGNCKKPMFISGNEICKEIDKMPTADVAPVVHAHWVLNPNGMDWGLPAWTCSHCGGRNDMIPPFITTNKGGYVPKNPNVFAGSEYCPNCGAKMDEEIKNR